MTGDDAASTERGESIVDVVPRDGSKRLRVERKGPEWIMTRRKMPKCRAITRATACVQPQSGVKVPFESKDGLSDEVRGAEAGDAEMALPIEMVDVEVNNTHADQLPSVTADVTRIAEARPPSSRICSRFIRPYWVSETNNSRKKMLPLKHVPSRACAVLDALCASPERVSHLYLCCA